MAEMFRRNKDGRISPCSKPLMADTFLSLFVLQRRRYNKPSWRHTTRDAWIVKTDSARTIQWQHSFGGSYDEYVCCQQTGDGVTL